MIDAEYQTRTGQARATAAELVDDLERGTAAIEGCLLKAMRLARLTRDGAAQTWIRLELAGYPPDFDIASLGDCEKYARIGRVNTDGSHWLASLPSLEAKCHTSSAHLDSPQPALQHGAENFIAANATLQVIRAMVQYRESREADYVTNLRTFSAMKAGIHAYASETLIALEFGDVVTDLVEAARTDVDIFVRSTCPQAAEQLIAMEERLRDGDAEALTAALTSCRRLVKTVADAVFPPQREPIRGRDGKERKAGNEEYKNRLIAFLDRRITSESSRALATSAFEHLVARLEAVHQKACKGVHDDVTIDEARLAVIHTYLFVAEVARASRPCVEP